MCNNNYKINTAMLSLTNILFHFPDTELVGLLTRACFSFWRMSTRCWPSSSITTNAWGRNTLGSLAENLPGPSNSMTQLCNQGQRNDH